MTNDSSCETNDLNIIAMNKFIHLIQADASLDENWQNAILELLDKGIPTDISALAGFLKEKNNA